MKESDQCVLMAELALAETTVSHGENQEGSRQCVSSTDGDVREDGGGWKKGRRGLVMFQILVNLSDSQNQVIWEK